MKSLCIFLLVWLSYLLTFSIMLNPGIGAVMMSAVFSLVFTVTFALLSGAFDLGRRQAFLAANIALVCASLALMLLSSSTSLTASVAGQATWISGRPTSLAFVHEAIFLVFCVINNFVGVAGCGYLNRRLERSRLRAIQREIIGNSPQEAKHPWPPR